MSLTCECDGGGDWYYSMPTDYAPLQTKRRRKCCSCDTPIQVGELSVEFRRHREPKWGSIEEKIFGEGAEIPIASWFMCESCGDQYFNLDALGFCLDITENMQRGTKRVHRALPPQERYTMTPTIDLRQVRTQTLRWTQEQMARELQISLRSYCRAEKGGPSRPIAKLAKFIVEQHAKDNLTPPENSCTLRSS